MGYFCDPVPEYMTSSVSDNVDTAICERSERMIEKILEILSEKQLERNLRREVRIMLRRFDVVMKKSGRRK